MSEIRRSNLMSMCINELKNPETCPTCDIPTDFTGEITEEVFLTVYHEKHYDCCRHLLKFPQENILSCDFTDDTIVKLLRENPGTDLLKILDDFYPHLINVEKLREIYEDLDPVVVEWFQEHGYNVVPARLLFTKAATK